MEAIRVKESMSDIEDIIDHMITPEKPALREVCNIAYKKSKQYIDKYSDYGVGATVEVEYNLSDGSSTEVYSGHNIRLSGMQIAMHAEQLALFQALMDISKLSDPEHANIERLVVVTTGDDMAINCGHCMQTLQSVCNYTGTNAKRVSVVASDRNDEETDRNPIWNMERATLEDFMGDTYVENRDRD